MYLFIEKGSRGEIFYICKRYSQANNKYMKNYDHIIKPWKYISYLDMSNLYDWGMSWYLPYGGFKLLRNAVNFDVNSISKNSSIGYILEVDVEYPNEFLKLYNDYSLAWEKLAIPYDVVRLF